MAVISTNREFAKRIWRRSLEIMTPSLSTSSTVSIWVSHSGFSISIESVLVTDIGRPGNRRVEKVGSVMRKRFPETKSQQALQQGRENHFCRKKMGRVSPCG